MAQNVLVGIFEVESEAFQAMTELKQNPGTEKSFLAQAALVKKENGAVRTLDWFDTGANTMDDAAIGGLVGALFGIIGGPIGILLGGSYGALIGSAVDTGDALGDVSMIEQITGKLVDNEVAIIGLASEEDEAVLDAKFSKFKTTLVRFDAAVVAAEVEEAQKMEKEMARQAKKELRDSKKAERKQKVEEKRSKLSADFEAFKAKFAKA